MAISIEALEGCVQNILHDYMYIGGSWLAKGIMGGLCEVVSQFVFKISVLDREADQG